MACRQTGILRILIDILLLVLVFLPVIIFELVSGVKPIKRGFYCDDESLSKPYRDSTVSTLVVIVVGALLNIVAIAICEAIVVRRENANKPKSSGSQLCCLTIRPTIVKFFEVFLIFLFGSGIVVSVTGATKLLTGRLRPHFLDVCLPNYTTFNCTDGQGRPRYVTEDVCTGPDDDKTLEMRLSFPSGHASLGTYCMVFLVMYLQARMTCRRLHLVKMVLQVTALWLAISMSLSRISDYKHHWSDVLGGALVGGITAVLVMRQVLALPQHPRLTLSLEEGRKREAATGREVTGEMVNEGYAVSSHESSIQL